MIETVTEAFRIGRARPGVLACSTRPLPVSCRETARDALRRHRSQRIGTADAERATDRDPGRGGRDADLLRGQGAGVVIVTLGPRGALVVGPDGPTHLPAVAVMAVDTTGAGDAFCGGWRRVWWKGSP